MKRSWIPAALMGALGLGYLAGQAGRGSRGEEPRSYVPAPVTTVVLPPAPIVEPPPPIQPPLPADPPPAEPLPNPSRALDDRLGEYPAWNGVDLDCPDIGHPVRVTGADPHGLDRDGDGIGCDGQ